MFDSQFCENLKIPTNDDEAHKFLEVMEPSFLGTDSFEPSVFVFDDSYFYVKPKKQDSHVIAFPMEVCGRSGSLVFSVPVFLVDVIIAARGYNR